MAGEKIAIKIVPTPATQDISAKQIERLARITKLQEDRILDRISKGKSIVIVTTKHPSVDQLIELIKSFGFSVTTTAAIKPPPPSTSAPLPRSKPAISQVDETEWRVGDTIENLYEVLDIRQGGMGAVYLVRHKRWNSMIAVKSLLQRLRGNEEDRALFVKEAETWIDIGFHPNIAACYYVRSIKDSPRIFIEYVDGGAINEWLNRRKPYDWDLLIDVMVQVGDGLHHAHTKGLVHRDVKPANCMMTKDGILKVTDFGLTKRKAREKITAGASDGTTDTMAVERESVTAAGMGTPSYMAPEMWIPYAEVGPQADIYAFGVMFFELCCGRKPFFVKPGERKDKLALAHVKKPPPRPRSIREDIPQLIEEIILKCLAKNPKDRYQSFMEVRQDLTAAHQEIFKRPYTRELPDELRLLSDALNNRAVSLMDLNHQEEAMGALRAALEADPHHPEATYNRGLLEWFRTKDPDWGIVMKLEEVVKTPEYLGRGAELLARTLLALGDADRAFKACRLAVSLESVSEGWLKQYAVALIGIGREQEAIAELEKYLADFPKDDQACGWLIGALTRQGHLDRATECLAALPRGSEIAGMTADEIRRAFTYTGLVENLVLAGHSGWVTCAADFPNSARIITGARDRTVKIWDAKTGKELQSFMTVGEPPARLWVSPHEQLVAVGVARSGVPIKILDLQSGRFVGSVQTLDGIATSLAFSPDGRTLLIVEEKGSARLWDVDGLKSVGKFKIPGHTASAVLSADAARPEILLSGMDRLVKRIRLGEKQEPFVFEKGHTEQITGLKANPEGTLVLTCGRDKQVMLWDSTAGTVLSSFRLHQEPITEIALNPVRVLAASCDPKVGVKVWHSLTGKVFRTFPVAENDILCMDFSRDGDKIYVGCRDMTLKLWDVSGRSMIPDLALSKIRPVRKQLKSDRKFKSMIDGALKAIKRGAFGMAYSLLRDSQTLPGYERSEMALDLLIRIKEHGTRVGLHGAWQRKAIETPSAVMDVTFSPSGINFLTAQTDHSVRVWSTGSGQCTKVLNDHTNLVATVRYSVNGREAASAGDDRMIRVWDLASGRTVLSLKGHTESVSSVAFSKDGAHLLSSSWDKTIKIWRLPDGTLVRTLKGHADKITAAAFVPDTEYIVSVGFEGIVKMWELTGGRHLRDLRGHKDRIMCVVVSTTGDKIVSGSMDGTARVWDLKTGSCIRTFEVGGGGVRTVALSPDQRFLATGTTDAIARLWNLETGECHREFQGHEREISSADFSANGRFLLSGSVDGYVRLWELDWEWRFGAKKAAT